jgi:hypothetical protein
VAIVEKVAIFYIGGATHRHIAKGMQVIRSSLGNMMHNGLNQDALAKDIF